MKLRAEKKNRIILPSIESAADIKYLLRQPLQRFILHTRLLSDKHRRFHIACLVYHRYIFIIPQKIRGFYYPFYPLKWVRDREVFTVSFLSEHILFQFFTSLHMKLPHCLRDMTFDRIGRNIQVFGNLLIGPVAGSQHRHGELGSG